MNRLVSLLSCLLLTATAMGQQPVSPEVESLYEEARAAQAAGRSKDAVADYVKIIHLSPGLAAAYNNLGRLYYNLGLYRDAISTLEQGLKVDPSMHPAEVILGASYYQAGFYDKATPELESALRTMPEDRFARITLVHSLLQQHKTDESVQQLHQLASQDPNDQEAWYLLGKLQLQLSQEAFARVHSIDPNSPLSHELSGEIMESMKNTGGAIAEYKKALELAPEDTSAMEHLANAYWSDGEWIEARNSFQTMIKAGPTSCLIHWKLANTLNELNESTKEALEQVDTALATCPSLGQARVEKAKILMRLGKPSEALPELLASEKDAPDEPSIQILLAKVYKGLGDPARAAAANTKFKQLLEAEHAGEEKHAAEILRTNP